MILVAYDGRRRSVACALLTLAGVRDHARLVRWTSLHCGGSTRSWEHKRRGEYETSYYARDGDGAGGGRVCGTVASAAPANNFTCAGGTWTGDPSTSTFTIIPSGNYSSITVTGVCNTVPGAVINVTATSTSLPVGSSTRRAGRRRSPSVITSLRPQVRSSAWLSASDAIGRFAGVPCVDDPRGRPSSPSTGTSPPPTRHSS